jgi:hypothetical protein
LTKGWFTDRDSATQTPSVEYVYIDMNTTKKAYLVAYDRGKMSSLWAFILARSEEEILRRYPELAVLKDPPAWMTPEYRERIWNSTRYDIDDEANVFVDVILNDRQRE